YVFITLFIYFYYFAKRPNLAVFSLASAIAMKVFPAMLLVLFIRERDYKNLLKTALLSVVLTLGALALAKGGMRENWSFFSVMQAKYFTQYILGTSTACCGLAFGHSIFGILRLLCAHYSPQSYAAHIGTLLPVYNIFVAVYALVISAYVIFYERALWKQVALLVLTFNLLPYVSADYKLIHLFIPVLLFIKAPDTGNSRSYCVLFALMLIPKSIYQFKGLISDSGYADISSSIILNPLLMLLISALIIWEGGRELVRQKRLKVKST
ncbi:MAG: hypothetical protein ABIG11_10310, partial [bacterium]